MYSTDKQTKFKDLFYDKYVSMKYIKEYKIKSYPDTKHHGCIKDNWVK